MRKLVILFFFIFILAFSYAQNGQKIIFSGYPGHVFNNSMACYFTAVADFNGDKKADLIVGSGYSPNGGSQFDQVAIFFMGPSSLSLTPKTTLNFPFGCDLIGMEALQTGDTVSSIQVLYGDTLATFRNDSVGLKFSFFPRFIGHQPTILRKGKIFNQYAGDESLIVDSARTSVEILHFNGSGYDSLQTIYVGKPIYCLEFGDFNADGLNDLVVICAESDTAHTKARVYCQSASGMYFWKEATLGKRKPYSARVADLFLDGYPDIVISSAYDSIPGISIANFVDTNFVPIFSSFNNNAYEDFTIADFNRDGYPDMVALSQTNATISVFHNNQNGQIVYDTIFFSYSGMEPSKYHATSALDYSGDGRLDFVFANVVTALIMNQNLTNFLPDFKVKAAISVPISSSLSTVSVAAKIFNVGDTIGPKPNVLCRLSIKDSTGQVIYSTAKQSFLSGAMAPGDSLAVNVSFDSLYIPLGAKILVKVQLDSLNLISELRKSNNIFFDSTITTTPDFVASATMASPIAGYFVSLPVVAKIFNIGSASGLKPNVSANITVHDSLGNFSFARYKTIILSGNLNAGDSLTVPIVMDSLNIPAKGKVFLTLLLDSLNSIIESRKDNNSFSDSIISIAPDFTVKSTMIAPVADHLGTLSVSAKIFNIGTATGIKPTINAQVTVEDSLGNVAAMRYKMLTLSGTMNAGDSLAVPITMDSLGIPAKGKLFLNLYLDSANAIVELREDNNFFSDSIFATTIDLCFGQVTIPPIYLGDMTNQNIKAWVKNIGSGTAPSGVRLDGTYAVNQEGTVTSNNFYYLLPSLAPGDSSLLSIPLSLSVYSGYPSGGIALVIDSANKVVEITKSNNSFSISGLAIPGPDLMVSQITLTPLISGSNSNYSIKIGNIGNRFSKNNNLKIDFKIQKIAPNGDSTLLKEHIIGPFNDSLGVGDYIVYSDTSGVLNLVGVNTLKISALISMGMDQSSGNNYLEQLLTGLGIIDLTPLTVAIYPNPASNLLFLDLPPEKCQIEIYTVSGELVLSQQAFGHQQIDIGHLTAGLYFAKIFTSSQVSTVKFVKK